MKCFAMLMFCVLVGVTMGCGGEPESGGGGTGAPESGDAGDGPVEPEALRKHVDGAVERDTLQSKRVDGKSVVHVKGEAEPYTGWVKHERGDGAVRLYWAERGVAHGPEVTWYGGGAK